MRLLKIRVKLWGWSRRAYAVGAALLILFSIFPAIQLAEFLTARTYQLDSNIDALIGKASPKLAEKLVLDTQTGLYQFNAEGKKAGTEGESPEQVAARLQKSVVGGKDKDSGLYSLELSPDSKKGITYYDNNSQLSFKLTPQFDKSFGRKVDGRLVYPMPDGSQAIYTVKGNGLKEDIVYQTAPEGGEVTLRYQFELPDTLQARLLDDGSVGVYSADPMLFGDMSFGGDEDREKIESARRTAAKDHLVFALPRPVIIAADGKLGQSSIEFVLQGDTLVLHAEGLETIKGAFSLDPSVVVTSSSDFAAGNDEGGIEFNAGQIDRAGLSGGSVGAWSTQTNLLARSRSLPVSAVHNGYIYVMGGRDEEVSVDLNTVTYAQINADGSGSLGPWVESPNTFANPRYYHSGATYNGYLYVYGGRNAGGTTFGDVQYAKINADGTTGAWSATTGYPGAVRRAANGGAHNGYLYHIGGFDGTYYDVVQYAPLNADGTVGVWAATTALPSARYAHALTFANGTAYVSGGVVAGGSTTNTAFFGTIAADGSIAAWTAAPSLPNARYQHNMVVNKGHLYMLSGGSATSTPSTNFLDAHYAQIYTNGSLGPWARTTDFNTAEMTSSTVAAHGNHVYILSGRTASVFHKYVRSSRIHPPGVTTNYATTTAIPTLGAGKSAIAGARERHATVTHAGYMYTTGGLNGTTYLSQVLFAPINADGSLGSWTATTALPAVRAFHTSVVNNGYLYVIGGYDGTSKFNTVYYAQLTATGGVATNAGCGAAWCTATGFTTARDRHASVVFNNYVYVIGGWADFSINHVQYAKLSATGTVETDAGCGTAWCTTAALDSNRHTFPAVIVGTYVYISGGFNGADEQYARFTATGAIAADSGCGTSWCVTGAQFWYEHALVAYNGYIYATGGESDTSVVNTLVRYARTTPAGPLAADAGCGSMWCTSASFTPGRARHTSVVHQDKLYVLGGSSGTTIHSDVQFSRINNGGSGAPGTYAAATALPGVRTNHASAQHNGYIYTVGGSDGTNSLADVHYALINANGSLGSWTPTSSLLAARQSHDAAVHNGYIYVLGGANTTGSITRHNDVQFAKINADGSLGTWKYTHNSVDNGSTSVGGFVGNRNGHASAVHNGYLYVLGGFDGTNRLIDVQFAALNADGTVGAWRYTHDSIDDGPTFVSGLPTAKSSTRAVVYNGYIYMVGGSVGNPGVAINESVYAKLNANGTVGPWLFGAAMPMGKHSHAVFAANGYLYALGGSTASAATAVSYIAALHADGSFGQWDTTSPMAAARHSHRAEPYQGTVYVLGGVNSSNANIADAQSAALGSIARTARYSKLIDLGTTTTIADITFTGSLPGGKSNIRYRTAGTDGVFGASQTAATLSGACIGGGTTRYVLLSVLMDDSAQVVFPGTANRAAVQDLTVRYSSAAAAVQPQTRLRAGKFFASEVQQPLDIAKGTGAGAVTCN